MRAKVFTYKITDNTQKLVKYCHKVFFSLSFTLLNLFCQFVIIYCSWGSNIILIWQEWLSLCIK